MEYPLPDTGYMWRTFVFSFYFSFCLSYFCLFVRSCVFCLFVRAYRITRVEAPPGDIFLTFENTITGGAFIDVYGIERTPGDKHHAQERRSWGVCDNEGGGGGCTQFVHGRSRMTIDPRISAMPGRSTSGFHGPGRRCLHQAPSAVRCSASRMKGECILPKTARKKDFGTLCPLSCLWMTASTSYTLFSGVTTPETTMGITNYYLVCNCLVGALPSSN